MDRFLSKLVGREALLREHVDQRDDQIPRALPATLRKTRNRGLSICQIVAAHIYLGESGNLRGRPG